MAIQVDGCFWHGCPQHGTKPRANSAYWQAKLERNQARDARDDRLLQGAGWSVVRIWEHERPEEALRRVIEALAPRGATVRSKG